MESDGYSGGWLNIWDMNKLVVLESLKGGYSLTVKCLTLCKKVCWITNVYGPNDYRERIFMVRITLFVRLLLTSMVYWWDFNTTRWAHERFPIGRATRGMRKFNNFIDKANLLEVPLSNGWFTWSCHGSLFARSLIDRFFISKDWDDAFENSRVNRQSPIFSDHFPLILEAGSISWGPSPFRFSNSWFLDKACVAVIKTSWRQSAVAG